MRGAWAIASVLAAVLAGCGGGSASQARAEREVRAVATSFLHAVATGDDARACGYESRAIQEETISAVRAAGRPVGECVQAMKAVFYGQAGLRQVVGETKIISVSVNGNHATIQLSRPGKKGATTLNNGAALEHGVWKLTSH